jgi:hypothetical protein
MALSAIRGREGAMEIPQALLVCLPERLHPVSRMFLELYIQGRITTQDFLWAFHLPNSDYLPVAACIVKILN